MKICKNYVGKLCRHFLCCNNLHPHLFDLEQCAKCSAYLGCSDCIVPKLTGLTVDECNKRSYNAISYSSPNERLTIKSQPPKRKLNKKFKQQTDKADEIFQERK